MVIVSNHNLLKYQILNVLGPFKTSMIKLKSDDLVLNTPIAQVGFKIPAGTCTRNLTPLYLSDFFSSFGFVKEYNVIQ